MKYFLNIILLCLVPFMGELYAQMPEADVRKTLIHEWIQQPVSTAVGESASGKCDGGKSYKFAATGKVDIHECHNGYMRTLQQSWTLKASEKGDWQLTVGSTSFELGMKSQPGKETLLLTPKSTEGDAGIEQRTVKLYRLVPAPPGKEVSEIEN